MEKVVKKALGYFKPKENENHTHVIFTEDEYNKNERKIWNLEDTVKKLERDYKSAIERYKYDADSKIAEIQEQADERVAEAHAKTEKHKIRADSFENINKNLIRIATERANAQRGLTPKKQHVGYILLSIDEYVYNCECHDSDSNKTKTMKLPCFRIRFQSPYQISFDLDSVKDLIYNDLLKKLCAMIGVNSVYNKGIDGCSDDVIQKIWSRKENFIFKTSHKANFLKSFWEVEYLSRDMITVPPELIAGKV